jgi:hypothetical protein
MGLNPGDHICAIYSTEHELVHVVADFLAEGLRQSERCWYLSAADEPDLVRASLEDRSVDTTRAIDGGRAEDSVVECRVQRPRGLRA